MKKKLLYFLPFFLSVTLHAGNLIGNPSFEEGIPRRLSSPVNHWSIRSFKEVFQFHSIDSSQARTGKRCALISIPEGNPKAAAYFTPSNKIRVEAGKKYRFSVWSKGNAGTLTLTRYDAEGGYAGIGGIKSTVVKAGDEWHETIIDYLMPASEKGSWLISMHLGFSGEGEIRYDDASVTEVAIDKHIIQFYPTSVNSEKTLYPIENEANPLLFYVYSSESSGRYVLELEPSADFRLLAAAPLYCVQTAGTKAAVSGRKITIPLHPKSILPMKQFASNQMIGTGLLYSSGAGTLDWKILKDGKRIDGGTFVLKPVKSGQEKLPKKFSVGGWYAPFLAHVDDEKVLELWSSAMMRSGIVSASFMNPGYMKKISDQGIAPQFCFWLTAKERCLTKLLKKDDLRKRVAGIARWAKGLKEASANWNFEPNLGEYYHMCPDCIDAFEKYSGKNTGGMTDGKKLEARFPEEYLAFRSAQMRSIMQRYAEFCHAAGIKASVCSLTTPAKRTPEAMLFLKRCFGNLNEYDKILDEYQPQIYQRPTQLWEPLESMMEYYPTSVVVFTSDERGNGSSPPYSLLTPESVYLETLMAAMLGARKIVLFVGYHTFDGRQALALRKALGTIAKYEDFFFGGKAETVGIIPDSPVKGRIYESGGKRLLAVINPDEYTSGIFEFKSGIDGFSLMNAENGKMLISENGKRVFGKNDTVRIEVKPASTRFFEIRKDTWKAAGTEIMPEKKAEGKKVLLNAGGWKISDDGEGIIHIEKNGNKAEVRYVDGAIIVTKGVHYEKKGTGGIFRDLFHYPVEARWNYDAKATYQPGTPRLANDSLKMDFSHPMRDPRLAGLVLRKTFTIAPDFSDIQAEIRIANTSGKPLEIAYWNHNRFDIPKKNAVVKFGKTKLDLSGTHDINIYIPADGVQQIEYANRWELNWKGNPPPEKAYLWTGDGIPSLELIGTKQTIKPGQELIILLQLRKIQPDK